MKVYLDENKQYFSTRLSGRFSDQLVVMHVKCMPDNENYLNFCFNLSRICNHCGSELPIEYAKKHNFLTEDPHPYKLND